jgi:hypothetical protein
LSLFQTVALSPLQKVIISGNGPFILLLDGKL